MPADLSTAIADLSSPEPERRAAAALTLAELGSGARPAAVPLVRAAADDDESTAQAATAAVDSLGPPDAADAPALLELLAAVPPVEDNPSARDQAFWAMTLLARLGPHGPHVAPFTEELLRRLESPADYEIQRRALRVTAMLGASDPRIVRAVERLASGDDPRISAAAQRARASLQGGAGS